MREPTPAEIQRACEAFMPEAPRYAMDFAPRMADALRSALNPPPSEIIADAEALARARQAEATTLNALKEM